jgi:tetratricopeptide (TPR) repeat protein
LLIDRLWSESALPVDPMNALQTRVSKLRRALNVMGVGDVVTREGVGYRASVDSFAVDAVDFADRVRDARAAATKAPADHPAVESAHLRAYDDALAAIDKVYLGDYDTARRLFDDAAAASREVGDGAGEVLAGYGYGLLAQVATDWEQARRHFEVAVDGFIGLGTPVPEGAALVGLGRCHEADGDIRVAEARFQEALQLGRRLGEPSVIASALEGLARVASAAGDRATATAQCAEAADIRKRFHRPAPPHEAN